MNESDLAQLLAQNPDLRLSRENRPAAPVEPITRIRGGKRPQQSVSSKDEPQSIRLSLPYAPSANRYWRNVNGRMVKSAEARKYRDAA